MKKITKLLLTVALCALTIMPQAAAVTTRQPTKRLTRTHLLKYGVTAVRTLKSWTTLKAS